MISHGVPWGIWLDDKRFDHSGSKSNYVRLIEHAIEGEWLAGLLFASATA